MKITDVKVHDLHCKLKEEDHLGISKGWITERSALIIQIDTDEGITGFGEGGNPNYIEKIKSRILGMDPFDMNKIWNNEFVGSLRNHQSESFGVEMALWDIMGKKMKMPLYKLLGGKLRDKIKVYASSLYYKRTESLPEVMAKEAVKILDQGFDSIKIKIGYTPERDIKCVKAVRRAVGSDVELTVDAQEAYTSHIAIRLGRKLEKLDVYWFEEPVPSYDLEGYIEVRNALDIAVAGGESLTTFREFARFISNRAFDIVQPDMIAGGISGCRKISTLAEAFNVTLIPHCWATEITVAAWLHLLSSIPSYPKKEYPMPPRLEYDVSTNPIRDALLINPLCRKGSYIYVPEKPGLGVEIDERTLKKYSN